VQSGHAKSLAFCYSASDIARIRSHPRTPLPPMPNVPFWLAKQHYARQQAYARVQYEAVQTDFIRAPLRIEDTDERTIIAWQTTWIGPHPTNQGSWNWDRLLRRAWRRPSAFHVGIWSGEYLCGLGVGRASKRRGAGLRHTLSVHFIESAHDVRHPLRHRVAALVISAADQYGSLIGASRLRLIDPLPGVIRLYEDYGFTVARKAGQPVYCERRILP
jgi:GNAT superfamily N-acetyltransferase